MKTMNICCEALWFLKRQPIKLVNIKLAELVEQHRERYRFLTAFKKHLYIFKSKFRASIRIELAGPSKMRLSQYAILYQIPTGGGWS